jgi:hypothetical protein
VVFVITGFIFYLTAATYAEATSMYPEAGGSSSFARRAFNEFASFFAAWSQMLNYTITIAISAFFVPHYFGAVVGWEALKTSPGDIAFGIGVVALLALVNVRGVKESAGVNVLLALVDFATQLLLVGVGLYLVLDIDILIENVSLGVAPTWRDFLVAIPVGMIAYTGIETISNMAEEARDERKTIPAAINRVVIAVFAIYALLPIVALSALPVTRNPQTGEYETLLGVGEEEGGFAGDPVLGVVRNMDLGMIQAPTEIYVGLLAATILFIATERGHHRRVAAGVLHGPLPPGARPPAPAASALRHPVDRDPGLRRDRLRGDAARPGRLPGQPLRVRGHALVHRGPRRRDRPADPPPRRRAALPGPGQRAGARPRPAPVRDRGGDRHRPGVPDRHAHLPRRGAGGLRLAAARAGHLPGLPAQPGPRPDDHDEGRRAQAGHRPRGRVRVGAARARRLDVLARGDGHRGQGRGPPPQGHPRHRADRGADLLAAGRGPPEQELAAQEVIEQAKLHGRAGG